MIILDIETSGLDPFKHSLLSIGAVDYNSGEEFYGECAAAWPREVDDFALGVNGFTAAQVRDNTKITDAELYIDFCGWVKTGRATERDCLVGGQQVGAFDLKFLQEIHNRIGGVLAGKWPFGYRSVDLHSVAYAKFGASLSLDDILRRVGLDPEPKPHNALTGAKLERDAFKKLLT